MSGFGGNINTDYEECWSLLYTVHALMLLVADGLGGGSDERW